MLNLDHVNTAMAARGPRWYVYGNIRRDEYAESYFTSEAAAEARAEQLRADGLYQVRIVPPVQYDDLAAEARGIHEALLVARAAVWDVTQQAAALAVTMYGGGAGISQARTAELLGVDRMTVRAWLGLAPRAKCSYKVETL